MDTKTESKVSVKLFAGYFLNPEIRMHLQRSSAWKQASIAPTKEKAHELLEIYFNGKNYIGSYLAEEKVTLVELKKVENDVLTALKKYCPDCDTENMKISIFPQVFVA